MDSDRIYELIGKHLAKEASSEEITELELWVSSESENRIIYKQLEAIWKQNAKRQQQSNHIVFNNLTDKISEIEGQRPGLSSGPYLQNARRHRNILKYAAAIVLIVSCTITAIIVISNTTFPTSSYLVNIVPKGSKTHLKLSDGSIVWLNGGSKIRFPKRFQKDKREIYLEGEAFFAVSKNKNSPFIIHLQNAYVKVLGTSFNIKAYNEDNAIEAAVVEGRVAFGKEESSKEGESILLTANQKASFFKKSGKIKRDTSDGNLYSSWREGKLVFYATPLKEAAKILERWYGIPVSLSSNSMDKCRLTGTFKNQSLEEVMNLISLTKEIEYKLENNKLLIGGTGCN